MKTSGAHGVCGRAVLALLPLALSAPALASYIGPASGSEGGSSWIPSEIKQTASETLSLKSANVRSLAAVDDAAARQAAITALLQAIVAGDWASLLNNAHVSTADQQQWVNTLAANGLTAPPANAPQRLWVAQMISVLMKSNFNPWALTDTTDNSGGHTVPDTDNTPPGPGPQTPEPSVAIMMLAGAATLLVKRRHA